MTTFKAEFKTGAIEFCGEGEKDWVTEQLDKILEKAPALLNLVSAAQKAAEPKNDSNANVGAQNTSSSVTAVKPLATFLKDKNATTNQISKFLATAVWLHEKGNQRIETKDVSKALRDSKQTKLGNPSDCLNQNVSKGFCEKDGNGFSVTDEGRNELSK